MRGIHTEQADDAFRCFEESEGIDPLIRDWYICKGLEIGVFGEIEQGEQLDGQR